MKILKPGKVEQRKFVCYSCGCVFLANVKETDGDGDVLCPQPGCNHFNEWESGEPYEEPVEDDRERLMALLEETPDVMIWPDAQRKITDYLIANGVTFREG